MPPPRTTDPGSYGPASVPPPGKATGIAVGRGRATPPSGGTSARVSTASASRSVANSGSVSSVVPACPAVLLETPTTTAVASTAVGTTTKTNLRIERTTPPGASRPLHVYLHHQAVRLARVFD